MFCRPVAPRAAALFAPPQPQSYLIRVKTVSEMEGMRKAINEHIPAAPAPATASPAASMLNPNAAPFVPAPAATD